MSRPSHVIERIQQIYAKRETVILPVPWCDSFSFELENIFTRLRIVAREKTCRKVTNEVTSMTSIFTPHEDCQRPKVVLIEGKPGIGKTTYCRKLAYDWATRQDRKVDESFPSVEVLLLLRCREIGCNIWEAIHDQVLPEDIEPEVRDMFIQFLKENPSKVLLVLDGLDEADPEKLALFCKLIKKEKLFGCFIVLTSCHEAGSNIRPYTDTLWQIVGFTRTDAECFITKYFEQSDNQHLAETLIENLWSENFNELTRNPLNTLLLCVIFEDLKGVFPNSRTKLYVEIVLFVLRRYENKNGFSVSDKDLLLVYKKELMILGRMALDSLHKGELYFEDIEGDLKESLLGKFGFVSIQAGGSKRAPCSRYVFFHKSFQEFLSAFFLAFSIIDGAMDCKSVANEECEKELSQVFAFMCGIIAMHSKATAVTIVKSIVNVSDHISLVYERHLRLALRFVDECKPFSETLHTELAHLFGKSVDLTSLNLSESCIGDEGANSLSQALRVNTSLTSLDLSQNFICDEGANCLSQALIVNTTLTSFILCFNYLFNEGAISLSQALRENSSLTSLDLSCNFIGDEGAISLSQALRVNASLASLDLSRNSIGDEGANSLSQALRVNTSLTSLDLSRNSIGDEAANSLSQALRVNTSLTSFILCFNYFFSEGAIFLSQALRVNSSLTFLDLSCNFIGDEGAISLSEALRVNTSLTCLNLSRNSIGDEGANSLSQALRVSTSLTSLDLSRNSIGDEGANSLFQALRVNTSLTSLDLSQNFICDEGVNSLSQTLRVNTSLTSFVLSFNYLFNEGANSLSQALTVNSSLTSLDLSCNFIGDEGAISLSQALRVNTSLTFLDLSRNSIGDEGTNSLFQTLRVSTTVILFSS